MKFLYLLIGLVFAVASMAAAQQQAPAPAVPLSDAGCQAQLTKAQTEAEAWKLEAKAQAGVAFGRGQARDGQEITISAVRAALTLCQVGPQKTFADCVVEIEHRATKAEAQVVELTKKVATQGPAEKPAEKK